MPKFIIETTATASIREFWSVEADNETDARNMLDDDGDAELIFDEVAGDEENRTVDAVHAFAAMVPTITGVRAASEAPAMLDALHLALERLEMNNCEGEEDETIAAIRAAIAAATGTA